MTTPIRTEAEIPQQMSYIQHGWEKCKRQPLVPIGAAATTIALLGASASLRSGNRKSFQNFLRIRVAAQGLTVVAMVVGAYMLTNKAEEAADARHRALTGVVPPDASVHVIPMAPSDGPDVEHMYPTRNKVKVSDFTRRLREAEEQHKADQEKMGRA